MSKKRYVLVTSCMWYGTDRYHKIDGVFETEEEALEAFGGEDEAWQQAIDDTEPSYCVKEDEDQDDEEKNN